MTRYRLTGTTARGVAASIEQGIRTGELATGERVPTIRELASDLGVSPATVAAAYRELRRRGLVVGTGRAGTRVSQRPPVSVHLPLSVPAGVTDLRSGGPDPDLLPSLEAAFSKTTGTTRLYGSPPVSERLADVATDRLAADGLDTGALTVVSGALDGVERLLGAWLRPGDRVAMEDPGYSATLDLLGAMGLEVAPVPLDDRGIVPEALQAALTTGVRAVVLTPRAQNPTGAAWDAERTAQLSEVLKASPEVLVIEDDHAGPASGWTAHSVCRGLPRWATVRSVSKWLGPDLRVAVVVGDPTTVGRVEGRQAVGSGWVSYVLQDAVAALWGGHGTDAMLERAARAYSSRRLALHSALSEHGLEATGSSGLTTWVSVGDEHAVVAGLLGDGWAVAPGERYRTIAPPGIRIAFATLEEADAPHFAAALARCVGQRPVRTG